MSDDGYDFEEMMKKSFDGSSGFNDDLNKKIEDCANGKKIFNANEISRMVLDTLVITAEAVSRACGVDEGMCEPGLVKKFNNILKDFSTGKVRISDAVPYNITERERASIDHNAVEISRNLMLVQAVANMHNKPNNPGLENDYEGPLGGSRL